MRTWTGGHKILFRTFCTALSSAGVPGPSSPCRLQPAGAPRCVPLQPAAAPSRARNKPPEHCMAFATRSRNCQYPRSHSEGPSERAESSRSCVASRPSPSAKSPLPLRSVTHGAAACSYSRKQKLKRSYHETSITHPPAWHLALRPFLPGPRLHSRPSPKLTALLPIAQWALTGAVPKPSCIAAKRQWR